MASFYDDEEDQTTDEDNGQPYVPQSILGKPTAPVPSPSTPDAATGSNPSMADMLRHLTAANAPDTAQPQQANPGLPELLQHLQTANAPAQQSPDMSANMQVPQTPQGTSQAPQQAPEAPKKSGFVDFLHKMFGVPDAAAQTKDEYGLTKPAGPQGGLLSKILGLAVPTLIGSTMKGPGRLNPLTALGTSYMGQQAGQNAMAQKEMENYQKNRGVAATNLLNQQKLLQTASSAKDTQDYRNKMAGIAEENAQTNKDKLTAAANKPDKEAQKMQQATYERNGLLDNLEEMKMLLKKIPSGFIEGRKSNAQSWAGGMLGGSKEVRDAVTKFKTLVSGMKMIYGKDFSGRYNNAEGQEIEKTLLPVLTLPADQQNAALEGAITLINNKYRQVQEPYSSKYSQTDAWATDPANASNPTAQKWAKERGLNISAMQGGTGGF
jgi:hypothetical protein